MSTWKCPRCETENFATNGRCEVCDKPRPIWTCPKCETVNFETIERCEVCNQLRPSVSPIMTPPGLLRPDSVKRFATTKPTVTRNWWPIWLFLVGTVILLPLITRVFPSSPNTTILQTVNPTVPSNTRPVSTTVTQRASSTPEAGPTAIGTRSPPLASAESKISEAHIDATSTAQAIVAQDLMALLGRLLNTTATSTRQNGSDQDRKITPTATARPTVNIRAPQTARARQNQTATAQANKRIVATRTAVARRNSSGTSTATARLSQPATGRVTSAGLNVRSGPGTEYNPPIGTLEQGASVSIIGWANDSRGIRWWKIAFPAGWVSSTYINESGCVTCIPRLSQSSLPSTPTPPAIRATAPTSLASNRGSLLNQGQNGWYYQYEQGRSSGNFTLISDRKSYDGTDCYIPQGEDYVRICADGELHPGQAGRVAYRWESTYNGAAKIRLHAHKIDTRCGDGIWGGIFQGEIGREPYKLGEFSISGSDNSGRNAEYNMQLTKSTYLLVMIDIRGNAQCDQSRVYIDVSAQ